MYARNDVKRLFYPNPNARRALAKARRRFAAWVDVRVARWIERCARNIEAAQRGCSPIRCPQLSAGWSASFLASSRRWDEPR